MKKRFLTYSSYILLLTCYFLLPACGTVDVFERNATIPQQSWSSNYKPEIAFTIDPRDTLSRYNIFIVIRHTDAYRYKNIWINVHTESPGGVVNNQPLNLQLATDNKGWLGSGMDDIFEHRIQITPPQSPERLSAGTYRFKLENIMREDPLKNVMNVGIRLEKAQ
ncbi:MULTISPECIES: gliding motility lipoprotein GldH [Niastella]|uniref:Gliding motility lipoprotein GldH n=1 Tax=Niastella soli TaxID=2821487 RepID=A0ABS3YQ58_9BACT|nr:gliding motility lipoprotein GldH [Niastella soli]MBO9200018.1 gliding motility lipoprotein GldH [Niastella soli]